MPLFNNNNNANAQIILPPGGNLTSTYTIPANQQYIVTGQLQVTGHVINNGRIAVI